MAEETLISLAPGIDAFCLACLPDGVALSVSRGDEASTLMIALTREERRELAAGLLAQSGDGFERTFSPERCDRPLGQPNPPSELDATPAPPDDPAPFAPAGAAAVARAQGFTGDICRECGKPTMRRNGTCLVCAECGATTGCS